MEVFKVEEATGEFMHEPQEEQTLTKESNEVNVFQKHRVISFVLQSRGQRKGT